MNSVKFSCKIIEIVKENEIIWNWNRLYKKVDQEHTWMLISKKLGRSVNECKKRWKGLRDRFNRLTTKGDINWIHYNELSFLKNIKRKGKRNNLVTNEANKNLMPNNCILNEYDGARNIMKDDETNKISDENYNILNNHEVLYKDNKFKEYLKVEEYVDDELYMKIEDFGIKCGEIFFYQNKFFFVCLFCNKRFDHSEELTIHCSYEHSKENNEFEECCDLEELDIQAMMKSNQSNCNVYYNKNINTHNLYEAKINQTDVEIESESSDAHGEIVSLDNLIYECALCSFNTKKLKMLLNHGGEVHPGEAIFKCHKCPQVFEKYEILLNHKVVCHKYSKSSCNVCDKKFRNKKDLGEHMLMHINTNIYKLSPEKYLNNQSSNLKTQESYFKCGSCNFETLEKEYYIEHCCKEHPDEEPFKCDICELEFSNFNVLEDHRNNSHDDKCLKCHICNKNFLTLSELGDHELTHRNFQTVQKISGRLHREVLKCGCCNFETQVIKMFLKHCEDHIVNGEKPFKCWVCGKIFKKYRYLIYHRRLHRRLNDSACSFCGKQFHTYRSLRDHERGHTGQRTVYKCQYCNKEFCYPETLRDHENIHTGNRPYKCKFCDREFSLRSTWQTHVRVKHLNDKRFECQICGIKCLKRRDALEHEASHSGNKLYICDICGNTFSKNSALISHLKSHENLRNYKCKLCGKGFNTATNLSRHMWVHSEERNWACELCGNKFVCKKNLQQHMKTHNKNVLYICEGCEKVYSTKTEFESHSC